MKFRSRSGTVALFAVFTVSLLFGIVPWLRADVYPPAIVVNGVNWSGGAGSYYGNLTWQGVQSYGYIYVSGGNATLSGSIWQDGYYAGAWDTDSFGDSEWNPNENWVDGSAVPFSQLGSYSRGVFSFPGLAVSSLDGNGNAWPPFPTGMPAGSPVAGGPSQLWVNGMQFYRFSISDTDYYYSFDYFDYVAINAAGVTSSDSLGVTGVYTPNAGGGVFIMSSPSVDVRPLAADGTFAKTTSQSAFGPPAVAVNGFQWTFQGTVGMTDYYMGGTPGQRLAISNALGVTLNDPVNGVVNGAGFDNNGVYQDLPESVRSLDAIGAVLTSEGRGPASVVVNGTPWYHSGVGGASYDAYFGSQSGQALYIFGQTVWLADPYNNVNASGTYTGGVFQFLGSGETVQAGDAGGAVIPVDPLARAQNMADSSTVSGNMDVYGNLFTLGTQIGNASTSGLCLSFIDQPPGSTGVPATISLLANRSSNQWMWSHATSDFTSTMPMMKLDAANCLTLYSSVDGTPQIVLNPQGTSTIKGAVTVQGPMHIQQRGDLKMGGFTSEPAQ